MMLVGKIVWEQSFITASRNCLLAMRCGLMSFFRLDVVLQMADVEQFWPYLVTLQNFVGS